MNPADPKIEQAIQRISAVYAGQDVAHAYYDPAKSLYVLVVSGPEAEAYERVIKAIHSLTGQARMAPHGNGRQPQRLGRMRA